MANGFLFLLRANARLGVEPFLRGGWQAVGWVVGETVINVSTVTATFLLINRFDRVGDWDLQSLYFMLGFVLVARGAANVFSGRNVLMISRKVARGQLDHVLIQPIPLWKALAAEGFSPFDLAVTLVLGLGILAGSATQLSLSWSPLWLMELLVNLIASAFIVASYQYLWGVAAFFAPRGAEEVNTASSSVTSNLSGYPLDLAPIAVKAVLLTIVPVGFIGWFPSRALLFSGDMSWQVWLTPAFASVLVAVTVFAFRKGLKRYARTGSGRYSDWGHRR